ncbi:MAG: VanZ family protein [Desulfobacteraceae bacterium]|nr:MAG: VanZ family protein [Desulfobacteraceae bacterium]
MKIDVRSFSRLVVLVWIISIGTVSYFSLIPTAEFPFDFRWSDKLCHSLAYLWLSVLPFYGFTKAQRALKAAFLMIPLGIGLEFAQVFVPERLFSLGDMIANSFGASIGIFYGRYLVGNR